MITNIADAGNECALGHLATTKLRSTRTETPDAALINRIVAGDKHAMQVLYSRHNLSVFRFVLRFLRDEAAAEDVVHEVFIDVWRRAGNFENQSRVSTWLLAIARNKAFVALRRRSTEELDDGMQDSIQDTADNPEVALQKEQTSTIMLKCLAQLSRAHREIVDLVYYHGKSVGEVAAIIGITPGTVKTRMFYARRRLAELLSTHGITTAYA